jgi:hypothetical protein
LTTGPLILVVQVWRDSLVANAEDKHGVIGFIDVRDRLRTRILPTTRDGLRISHDTLTGTFQEQEKRK